MTQEAGNYMLPIYGVSVDCAFFDDSDSPNAFALPFRMSGEDGATVVYGVSLINKVLATFASNSTTGGVQALGGIFAHEFGHAAQFKYYGGNRGPSPHAELQADFVAGWYTLIRNIQQRGTVNFREIATEMYNVGDYAFTSPTHHGTPEQRVAAYIAGVNFSLSRGGRASVNQALAEFDRISPQGA
jgi:hypothetical protein